MLKMLNEGYGKLSKTGVIKLRRENDEGNAYVPSLVLLS